MKNRLVVILILFVNFSLFAQNNWQSSTKIADSLHAAYQFKEALNYRKKALDATQNESDSIRIFLYALQQFTLAEQEFYQGRGPNPEAYALMQKALDTLKTTHVSSEKMSSLNLKLATYAFDFMYKQQDAEAYLEEALRFARQSPDFNPIQLIEMMEFSGYLKILARKYDQAIQMTENAIENCARLDQTDDDVLELKAKLLYNLSLVHNVQFLDIPQKEYHYTLEVEKILNQMEAPDIEHFILTYRRLALFENDYRNYPKAKGFMTKAFDLYHKHEQELRANPRIGLKLELTLYRAYISILNVNSKNQELAETIATVEKIVNSNELDEVEKGLYKGMINDITMYFAYVNPKLDSAAKYNNIARSIELDSKKAPYSLESYNQQARVNNILLNYLKKDYQKAITLIAEAEQTTGYYSDKTLLEIKAKCLLELNRPEEALITVNELLVSISESNNEFDFTANDLEDFTPGFVIADVENLVRLAIAMRKHYGAYTKEEEKLYWLALSQFENNMANTPLNKMLKTTFDRITAGLLNAATERDFTLKENNHLLSFMEKVSSQDLLNNYLLNREIAGATELYQLVEEEQYIRSKITLLKKQYQRTKNDSIRQQLFETELALQKLDEQLTIRLKGSSAVFTTPEIDITQFAEKNILKFKMAQNQLFLMEIHDGRMKINNLGDYVALRQEIEAFLINLNDLSISIDALKEQGGQLYAKLFENEYEFGKHTVVIPDDILYYLPFELLVSKDDFLIKEHIISYASNAYFIENEQIISNSDLDQKVVLFAPAYTSTIPESQLAVRGEAYSLSGAEEEVSVISTLVAAEVFKGKQASKSKFKSLDKNASVLHLAMHANLNDNDPELSSLLFSSSETDYEMYISELYGLNFNAELAVLSACNTGVGGFKDGGELVSIHHAFTTAGIPSKVASLWNAPDLSTKAIMIDFYKNLRNGQDKATALRQAKLRYLNNPENEMLQHPFYWAGFILSGDNTPLQLQQASFWYRYPILIAAMLFLVVVLVFILIKKKGIFEN